MTGKSTWIQFNMVMNMTHGNMTLPMLLLLLLVAGRLYAQTLSLPYFNGWEDPAENALWTMNSGINGTSAANRWYVSTKEAFSGSHSLLISDLSLSPDTAAVYSNNTVSIVAARTIILPRGTYDLSFAWRAYGEYDADGLYVAWINSNEDIATSVSMPHSWAAASQPFRGRMFSSRSSWSVETVTIQSQGIPMRLAFLWINDNEVSSPPSVAIDNIQISENVCGEPAGFDAVSSGTAVALSWLSSPDALSYEVWYEATYADVADTVSGIRGGQLLLEELPEGLYNFFLRVICAAGDTSIWYSYLDVVVNNTDGACIDYTDLESDNVVCYLSSEEENPYQTIAVDRYGIDGAPSRHTVNTSPVETDPRTGGMLKTVPDGELVSIRLGNWEPAQSEAIEYTLPLDSGANIILLMKYAVVLEVPKHDMAHMPKFHLEILDAEGTLINPMCGAIDFYATMDLLKEGWHQAQVDNPDPIIYKDWTTIGVNLSEYAKGGDTSVKIRLATNDCTEGAHFGYAYFTLSCAEAEISGLACGDFKTEALTAPDGFYYKWYKGDDSSKTEISDSITLDVGNDDTGTYCCDVISKENPDCYFTLTASLLPRFPKAAFVPEWCPENCTNYMRFANRSFIETSEGVADEAIEEFEWSFGDGRTSSERNPVIPVSDDGDTLHVSLRASIADGMCWDVFDSVVIVPACKNTFDTTFVQICRGGSPYIINGVPYSEAGDYPLPPAKTRAGCDSTHVVSISVIDTYETYIDTALCAGDTLYVGQSKFCFTGSFTEKVNSVNGCDSIIHVNLTVLPEVTFGVEVRNAADGPASGKITITDTLPGTSYSIDGVLGGRLDSLPVGSYTIVCYNGHGCSSEPRVVEITAECAEVVIDSMGDICADDGVFYIPLTVTAGKVAAYSLRFGDREKSAGFVDVDSAVMENNAVKVTLPDSVRPDRYAVDIALWDYTCGWQVHDVPFAVLYPSGIIRQKWNNVLALLNSTYNGGYEFSSFRWYRNGVMIGGADGSYLYLGDGVAFAVGDEYRAELTRSDDGVTLMTCPLYPEARNDTFPYPVATSVPAGSKVKVNEVDSDDVEAVLWSVGGTCCSSQRLSSSSPYFVAPQTGGVYILRIGVSGRYKLYKVLVI